MGTLTQALLTVAALALTVGGGERSARAEERELTIAYVPAPDAESLVVEQRMGRLTIRGWDRPEVKIVANKRAPSAAALDRLKVNVDMANGRLVVRAGVRVGDAVRALPAESGSVGAIDLTIDAPRAVQLSARTWAGDLDASGFRAGAELSSSSGAVYASDIAGPLRTNAVSGRQELRAIHGDVEADGVAGDLELIAVDGEVLVARVVEGQITAREVRTPVVRLFSSAGRIVLIGSLRLGGRYDLMSLGGDVQVSLTAAPFSLRAEAPEGAVRTGFALQRPEATAHALSGDFQGGGPLLVLTSQRGNVSLQRR